MMAPEAHWPQVPLRELCSLVQYGYTARSGQDFHGPHFLRITDITEGMIDWSSVPHCEITGSDWEKYRLEVDDIVVARSGSVGYAKQIRHSVEAVFASYLVRLKVKDSVCPRFIGAIVQSKQYREYVLGNSTGVAQPNANAKVLTSFPTSLPPLPSQRKIAAILTAYDDLIENNLRRMKILEEMAQNLYREWFVRFRFPGHQHARFIDSPLGRIPEGWGVKALGELVSTQYGYTESAQEEPIGPKYLRGMDINKTTYIDWDAVPYCPIPDDQFPKYQLAKGDIVIIRMADPGKVGIVEKDVNAVFASYLVRLSRRSNCIGPYYLFHFLIAERYQGYITGASTGTTRKSASAGVLTGIAILTPQGSILADFESQVQVFRRLLNTLVERNSALRHTRDLLLPRLISGEVDVSELDITVPEEAGA
jgi:type I restriction enzyme S subunit